MSNVARLRKGIDPTDIPDAERAMDAGADEIEQLREALLTNPCPHPVLPAPNNTVRDCIEGGHCGCDNKKALGMMPKRS